MHSRPAVIAARRESVVRPLPPMQGCGRGRPRVYPHILGRACRMALGLFSGLLSVLVVPAVTVEAAPPTSPLGGPPNACGQISLALCFKLMGGSATVQRLCEELPPRSYGSSLFELQQLAEMHGIHGRCVQGESGALLDLISRDRPAIVRSASRDHFYVVTGYSPDRTRVRTIDAGLLAFIDWPVVEFDKEFGGQALILSTGPLSLPRVKWTGWVFSMAVVGVAVATLIFVRRGRRRHA